MDVTEHEAEERLLKGIERLEKRLKRPAKKAIEPDSQASVRRAKTHLEYLKSRTIDRCLKDIRSVEAEETILLVQLGHLRTRKKSYQDFIDSRDQVIQDQLDKIARHERFHAKATEVEVMTKLEGLVDVLRSAGVSEVNKEDLKRVYNAG